MREAFRNWIKRSDPVRRNLSAAELKRVQRSIEVHGEKWSDFSRDIAKWIFATLITLGTGGIYLVLTLGLNPGVAASALTNLFLSLGSALTGAIVMLFNVSERIEFADRISRSPSPKDEIVEEGDVQRFLSPRLGLFGPLLFAVISFGLIGMAGSKLSENITPCSSEDLEYSISAGENIVPDRTSAKTCYFYEIDGLSNDPLERARQEIKLIKSAKSRLEEKERETAER